MINSKIKFAFTKIKRGKGKNLIFHYIFLNKDISITVLDIDMKFGMVLIHTYSDRDMSQIFSFRSCFFLCDVENDGLKISKRLYVFLYERQTKA